MAMHGARAILSKTILGIVSLCLALPTAMAQSGRGLALQLTHVDIGEPFPSPDGKKILYLMRLGGLYQLFTMNTDGSQQVQITHDAFDHDSPSWSPDGKKFAFVATPNGHEVIYAMNMDGKDRQALTSETLDSIHPTWSPDSKKVIYCSDDDMHPPKKNASEIYMVDVETKKVTTLISGGTNTYASWSPDGTKIAFRKMLGEMNSEVFVADSDGTNQKNLTNHPAFDGWPAWSPDGKQIAFASNRRSSYQIFVMDADGSNVHLVANTEGRATEPRFSIDGKTIYFTNCINKDFGVDCEIMSAPSDGIGAR